MGNQNPKVKLRMLLRRLSGLENVNHHVRTIRRAEIA
jgi:hypothetical protein